MTSTQKSGCPLVKVREALHLERNGLAALAGCDYTKIVSVETGYFATVPSAILKALTPFLGNVGTDPERLEAEFRAWRKGLGEEIRRKTEKDLKARGAVV